jgi:hypothetical protein
VNRYSLLRQANLGFALLIAATSGLTWLLMARPGPGLFAPFVFTSANLAVILILPLVAFPVSTLIPKAFLRWTMDRNPLLGSIFLSLFYVYIFIAATLLIYAAADVRLDSIDSISAAVRALAAFLGNWGFIYPLALMAYLSLIVCPYLLLISLIGTSTFHYLGGRRDYL